MALHSYDQLVLSIYDCEFDCVSNIFICQACVQELTQQDGEERMRSIPCKSAGNQG